MANKGQFKPGQSGNPKGRPKKSRAWTEILERAGSKTVEDGSGKNVARKRLLAEYVMTALTTGKVEFSKEHVLEIKKFRDWSELAKWVYTQIDGPARPEPEDGEIRRFEVWIKELVKLDEMADSETKRDDI